MRTDVFSAPLKSKGPGYGWLYPEKDNKTRWQAPKSYSPHVCWKEENLTGAIVFHTNVMQKNKTDWDNACKTFVRAERRWDQLLRKEIDLFLSTYFGVATRCVGIGEGCSRSGETYYIVWCRRK